MPEGDTIFRAARTLNRALAGHVVTRFESVYPALTRVHEVAPITGRTITRVDSVGKHLLFHFSGDLVLRTHMRMSGSWHIYRPGERWQRPTIDMRIVVATDQFVAVAFNVPIAEFETEHTLQRHEAIGNIGPDLLSDSFDADTALQRLRAHDAGDIAETLLNQRAMSGIGNIFKSEVLFVAGINPFTPTAALSDDDLRQIIAIAKRLLKANVRNQSGEGITTHFTLRSTSVRAEPNDRVWVYHRAGQPCRKCGTPIATRKQGPYARGTYWCPTCQPMRSSSDGATATSTSAL
jgi:endonuclease-8